MTEPPVIESVDFKQFKVLREATLPLSPLTLLVGANGSGKSTALEALRAAGNPGIASSPSILSAGMPSNTRTEVVVHWGGRLKGIISRSRWTPAGHTRSNEDSKGSSFGDPGGIVTGALNPFPIYSFNPRQLAAPVTLIPNPVLTDDGTNLATVLDKIAFQSPERFENLNTELQQWISDFDRVLFDTPGQGQRSILLRTHYGKHKIPARALSDGTLMALGVLTVAYDPWSRPIIAIEDPDRGLHPRLLRDVKDALFRLAFPSKNEKRDPVQVIATTHSPYLLDLFGETPELVVIAEKTQDGVKFERLTARADIDDIISDNHLGEAWFSGVLGGVPEHK